MILVIGESCVDVFTYGECTRLCPEAPVPVFNPTKVVENLGMAYNVYKNLNSLGNKSRILTNENYKRITKTRFIDKVTNHMFMRLDENDKFYKKCQVKKINLDLYDAVVISDYDKGFLREEDIEYIAKNHNMVFLDTKKNLGPWAKYINFIKINFHEYQKTKHLIDKDMYDNLIITMGAEGAKHKNVIYPVDEVEIKDVSGAGDTFLAGFVTKYMKTKCVESSINFANECATKVVQKKGVSVV